MTVALALSVAFCGESRTAPTSGALDTYRSPHFVFQYPDIDRGTIASTAQAVEAEYDRILAELGSGPMPTITVTFYLEHSAMVAATSAVAGVVPAWASGLVTARDQIHMMSLNLPAWGPYQQRLPNLVHEFAHGVSLAVNPSFGNRPRWLWEAVAIYAARQRVDPRTLPWLTPPQTLPFSQLNSFDNTRVYDVGYLIGEFIVSRGGLAALQALIRNNGDTSATFGLTLDQFEADWLQHVRANYF
jgi:hypothetical protein